MSAAGIFSIYSPSIIYAGPTTLNITSIQSAALEAGAKINRAEVGGKVDPGANILAFADPTARLGTRSLSALFGAMPLPFSGLKLTGGGVLRFQQRDDDTGFFATSTTHVTETFASGYLTMEGLEATQDDEAGAVAQLKAYVLSSDGITDPVTRAVNADFGSGPAPAFGTEYYMGPCYLNGAQLAGLKKFSIQPGLMYRPFRGDGNVFPVKGTVNKRRAVFRLTFAKLNVEAGVSLFLRSVTNLVCYLWKAADNGSRVSAASAAHIKFTASAGAWGTDSIEAQDNEDGTLTVSVYPTTVPTVTVDTTIP